MSRRLISIAPVLCLVIALAAPAKDRAKEHSQDSKGLDYYNVLASDGWVLRWPKEKFPLRVYIGDGSSIPGFRPEFIDIFMTAMYSWQDATQGKITFKPADSRADADIIVDWASDLKKNAEPGKKYLNEGVSLFEDVGGGNGTVLLKRVQILIPVLRPTDHQPITNDEMTCTCLHEIGHALGLDQHSPNSNDMMYRFNVAGTVKSQLSERDVRTIQRLYQSY